MTSKLDTFLFLLQKIRESPEIYLGRKSLISLVQFWNGYNFRLNIEEWEKSTGHSVIMNFDNAMKRRGRVRKKAGYPFMKEFSKFVHSYYDQGRGAYSVAMLISTNCNSEEEAFDKYFELHDMFLEQNSDLPFYY